MGDGEKGEKGRWGDGEKGEKGRWGDGEMGRMGDGEKVKAIEEKRMSYTEINSKTLKGFNINNPGLGGTTPPGESDERTEKAHLQS